MYRQYPQYYYMNLVPGTTAGTTSPGAMNYPAGMPATVYAGSSQPPLASGVQTYMDQQEQQTPQTLDDVLQNIQLQQGAIALESSQYTQGYLKKLIGKTVRVEFLIGENSIQDRIGVLLEVGIDYIILREAETDDNLLCDAYAIKFVNEYL